MEPSLLASARSAAIDTARALGLPVEEAIVVHNSNRIAVRLLPCDVLARVATEKDRGGADVEVTVARHLTDTGTPAASLDPRVSPAVYAHEGFVVAFWTYHEPLSPSAVGPSEFAVALVRLHAGLGRLADVEVPHFTDRVEDALAVVRNPWQSPELSAADRDLLRGTLERVTGDILRRRPTEQVLHGEPHPGNLMRTADGLLFMDLETCCRGPVEFDVAHAPENVGDHYPGLDRELLRDCRTLVLAMVTTWRWDRRDELPGGHSLGVEWLSQLRAVEAR